MRLPALSTALALLLFTVACGGGSDGSSLTGPSNRIPNVAGSYSGSTTVSLPELRQSVTCPTTTSDSCGVYNVTASGGFFGRSLQMSLNATHPAPATTST